MIAARGQQAADGAEAQDALGAAIFDIDGAGNGVADPQGVDVGGAERGQGDVAGRGGRAGGDAVVDRCAGRQREAAERVIAGVGGGDTRAVVDRPIG